MIDLVFKLDLELQPAVTQVKSLEAMHQISHGSLMGPQQPSNNFSLLRTESHIPTPVRRI